MIWVDAFVLGLGSGWHFCTWILVESIYDNQLTNQNMYYDLPIQFNPVLLIPGLEKLPGGVDIFNLISKLGFYLGKKKRSGSEWGYTSLDPLQLLT